MRTTPRKPERPSLWIIAGPNGSGKSSFYNRTDIEGWGGSIWIINPDLLTQTILEQEHCALEQANLAAVQRIEKWLDHSIDVYQTIGVETVLSTSKYRALVQKAKARNFRICLIFILLRDTDMQIARIRVRVAEGGHDVPADKIIARRQRSLDQLIWFLDHADEAHVFDNSTTEPQLLITKSNGREAYRLARLPKDLKATFDRHGIELLDGC